MLLMIPTMPFCDRKLFKERKEPLIIKIVKCSLVVALAFGSAPRAVQASPVGRSSARWFDDGFEIFPVLPLIVCLSVRRGGIGLIPRFVPPTLRLPGGGGPLSRFSQPSRERNLTNYTGAPRLSRDQWTAGYKGSCTFWDWAESAGFCAFLIGESCRN